MISVIITAYNVQDFIQDAVRSVLRQTFKDVEIVVVCDKPTDETEILVDEIAEKDSRIRVIKNERNVGAGMSRKVGIEAANGQYVMFLDGDDYYDNENFLQDLYDCAVNPGAQIVSGGVKVLHQDGSWDATCYGNTIVEGTDKVMRFWGNRTVYLVNRLIDKRLFEQIPYSPRRYVEDTPVIIPMLYIANKVAYIDNIGYVYRMRGESLTHTTNRIKNVIFRGLCWCDLMEFFSANDSSIIEMSNMKGFLYNIIKTLNSDNVDMEQIQPYIVEYAELWARLNRIISIEQVAFKI